MEGRFVDSTQQVTQTKLMQSQDTHGASVGNRVGWIVGVSVGNRVSIVLLKKALFSDGGLVRFYTTDLANKTNVVTKYSR